MNTIGNSPFVARITRFLSEGELAILLLASPLFLFIRPSFVFILLLLPFLWMVRFWRWGRFVPRTPVDWSILGLLVMTLISALVSPDLLSSLGKIAGLVYAIATFYALVEWGKHQGTVLPITILVIGLGAGVAFLSFFGTQWHVRWPMMEAIKPYLPRIMRDLPGAEAGFNPNTVSGTLITFMPLQVSLLWALLSSNHPPKVKRLWLTVAVAASLLPTAGILFLAQSRAALTALGLGLMIMTGIILKRFRLVFFLMVLAVLAILVVKGPVQVSEWLVQQGWMVSSAEGSWVARVERWSRWLWGIADFPLTGTGMDVFRHSAWNSYPFFYAPPGEDLGHAHNAYLHTALDLGLPGLISYLALLGGTLVTGWQSYRRSRRRLTQLIVLGGVVGLATHAVWGLVDVVPLGARTNFLWWMVAALVITVVLRDDWGAEREPGPVRQTDKQETA